MTLNNLFLAPRNRLARLRALSISIALWMMVIGLCLISVMLLQLSISAHIREKLHAFLTHHPLMVACSALLPLSIAGCLITYLLRNRASFTFYSALLKLDINPDIIATTIERGWNRVHPDMPIICQAVSTGHSLKVAITADPPPKQLEQQCAEELHTWAMEQLQTLLIARHPITFNIQWTPHPSLPVDASLIPHA